MPDLGIGGVYDCSFEVHAGEVLGIAGMVGAGRTELVRAVFGADKRSSGTIEVHGVPADINSPEAAMAAGLALLPEDRKTQGNVMDFSIRHNITLASLREHRVAPRVAAPPSAQSERSTSSSMIDRLGISTPHDRQAVRLLSGRQPAEGRDRQVAGPGAELLIFDEPTHGVDVDGKEEIYRIAEELAAQGKSVIFISSEFSELVGLCHRVAVMREKARSSASSTATRSPNTRSSRCVRRRARGAVGMSEESSSERTIKHGLALMGARRLVRRSRVV